MDIPPPSTQSVTIYSRPYCVYCEKCKVFLEEKGIPFNEVKLDVESESYDANRDYLVSRSGCNHKTYPFVFVGDTFVGGYTDLVNAYSTLRLHDLCKVIGINLEHNF